MSKELDLLKFENTVRVTGSIHLPKGDRTGKNKRGIYLHFSLRHASVGYDGIERTSFLPVRVFDPDLQEWLRGKGEDAPVCLEGKLHASTGSGKMYILAESLEDQTK